MKTALVTGGAGFIGQNLCRDLLADGWEVRVIDNFSSSHPRNLKGLDLELIEMDLRKEEIQTHKVFEGVDCVFHLAADVDNRKSWEDPYSCISNNIASTMNVGLAARNYGVSRIIYSSTGTVYGDRPNPPYKEEDSDSSQTSLYGATKFAGESVLSVFSEHYDLSVVSFRFVGVLGPGYSHGHVFDFVQRLIENPESLHVLGDGYQKKAYVHVKDLTRALLSEASSPDLEQWSVLNLGRPDFCTVRDSVGWITSELQLNPQVSYQSQDRGWVGDNPHLYLDTKKLVSRGWSPEYSIQQSIRETASWLYSNQWIFSSDKSH